jgi:hypothetical protein
MRDTIVQWKGGVNAFGGQYWYRAKRQAKYGPLIMGEAATTAAGAAKKIGRRAHGETRKAQRNAESSSAEDAGNSNGETIATAAAAPSSYAGSAAEDLEPRSTSILLISILRLAECGKFAEELAEQALCAAVLAIAPVVGVEIAAGDARGIGCMRRGGLFDVLGKRSE